MEFWLVQTKGEFSQVLIQAKDARHAMDRAEQIPVNLKNDTAAPRAVAIKDSPFNWPVPIFADVYFEEGLDARVAFGDKMGILLVEDLAAQNQSK